MTYCSALDLACCCLLHMYKFVHLRSKGMFGLLNSYGFVGGWGWRLWNRDGCIVCGVVVVVAMMVIMMTITTILLFQKTVSCGGDVV